MEPIGDQDGNGARIIKRYANRKLYDTRDSRYVTLQQIARLIRDGEHVTVIDNTTKDDLTSVTLAQIIYEEEKNADGSERPLAPAAMLRRLIQQSGERLVTTLREGPVGRLMARKEEEDEGEPRERRSVLASSREAFDELSRLADDRVRGLLGHAAAHVQQLQAEVKRLQDRIEELEGRLVMLSRRKREGDAAPRVEKDE